ncbi:unnamed protein product, partial [Mesorhabditis belari]|uniref:BPTI/Kunitz inhibitor domain-containing protein n=1 Tax=Mesorhabditis belari TaxID=2138241 RepID=A0AAF3EWY8_9BILA
MDRQVSAFALAILLSIVSSQIPPPNTETDATFLSAMKNLIWGPNPDLVPPSTLLTSASVSVSGAACTLPQQIGTGPYRIPRWYYNPARQRCELFYWSGCCGNQNNFQTFQSCQQVCEVDPCEQDNESGVGALQLSRWFFNKKSKLCEQFIYFGSGGNRNNFETLQECQAQCPESPNPCAVQTTGPLVTCLGGNSCGGGYYCHSGAAQTTQVCCPKPSTLDRCQQPLNIGIGNENLQRWYFNPLAQQCQTCVYKGLQGNENNFGSRNDCENACVVNPCRVGTPFRSQGVTVQCSAMNPTVCPAGYYCHIGADQSTSLCCQALGTNPCTEPMVKGEGSASLTRFFYDSSQRRCLTFNYLGTKGNMNNFQTRELCEGACPVWTNPCSVGIPIMGADQRPMRCSHVSPCPPTHFCHLGFDEATTVCCAAQGDPCQVSLSEGVGNHVIQRWFYNQKTRQCQPFTYRGLEGNENNFLLREHCEATCPVWINPCPQGEPLLNSDNRPAICEIGAENGCPTTHWCHPGSDPSTSFCCPGNSDPCVLAKSEGEGPLVITRYYFDATRRQCIEFTYKGLRGNANNFLSEGACAERCPVQIDPCPITFSSLAHVVTLTKCSGSYACPDQQWCHIGATEETTVCCPNGLSFVQPVQPYKL